MKKSLFFFAAAAIALTACTNDDDALQTGQVQNSNRAVAFDTYTAGTTRAGDPTGVMTTDKLKTTDKGFGVFAVYQDGTKYGSLSPTNKVPNFMFNQQVKWSDAWTYSPLKYWPNETTNDSQTSPATSTHTDYLSFFAYAPYVVTGATPLTTKGDLAMDIQRDGYKYNNPQSYYGTETSGIMAISSEEYGGDPLIEWGVSQDLDNNVDLLWGVAPSGGLSYTDVAGNTTTVAEGLPLKDMVKPDKDQKMKFLFQHALSRIGLSVVSAIDQIAPGGIMNSSETRVLIKSVEIWGDFGTQGVLNLNNGTENVANWIAESIIKSSVSGAKLFDINATNGNLAANLRYVDSQISAVGTNADDFAKVNPGVGTSEQTLLAGGADPNKKATDLTYAADKLLYKKADAPSNDYVIATTTATEDVDTYTKSEDGNTFTQIKASGGGAITMSYKTPVYYKIVLGTKRTVSAGTELGSGTWFKETVAGGMKTYTKYVANGSSDTPGDYYASLTPTELSANNYTGDCYTALTPRYFMVIPTGDTPIKVKITYAVVTKDTKLTGNVSDVENAITKEISLDLKNGKSYNLKLILGLTSVKMEAEVADWKVDGSTDVNLPQNNE